MPFDNTPTTTHTLAELAEILRDRSRWPDDFVWDYGHCAHCAMGLAGRLWDASLLVTETDYVWDYRRRVAGYFALTVDETRSIFFGLNLWWREITPEHVADAIDAYLAKQVR